MLVLAYATSASAADIWVVTDQRASVKVASGVRVIELGAPDRIKAELSTSLPADSERASPLVHERIRAGGADLQRHLAMAYQDVADAWRLGIAKTPAVVVDRRYVIYGEPDVARAIARIEAYRSAHP